MSNSIVIKDINKTYGRKQVLHNISLNISSGMFGLIGHNGAGKTTLMRIITTLLKPTSGKVFINDFDISKDKQRAKKIIGFLPQEFNFYPQLDAVETLDYIARLNGVKDSKKRYYKVMEAIEKVNLMKDKDYKVGGYSGGMKRRLGIATAIIKDPSIIIVDEPTAGLDPEERVRFRTMLVELSEKKIVILSTHIVEDISASCEKIALLDHGKLAFVGNPSDWLKRTEGKVWEINISDRQELIYVKNKYNMIALKQTKSGTKVRVLSDKVEDKLNKELAEPNLEDAYLYFKMNQYGEASDEKDD